MILLATGLVAVGLVVFRRRWSGIGVSAILVLLWIWLGAAYPLAFFAAVNPLAHAFAGISIVGGVLLL